MKSQKSDQIGTQTVVLCCQNTDFLDFLQNCICDAPVDNLWQLLDLQVTYVVLSIHVQTWYGTIDGCAVPSRFPSIWQLSQLEATCVSMATYQTAQCDAKQFASAQCIPLAALHPISNPLETA